MSSLLRYIKGKYDLKNAIIAIIIIAIAVTTNIVTAATASSHQTSVSHTPIRKVLFIGDSMTGWMAERLNAYGEKNGFEVATIVWDGSTIKKWASSPKLKSLIAAQKPDAVFVSLGLNELFEPAPEKTLDSKVNTILEAVGDTPLLWVGPPTWPGHDKGGKMDKWLSEKLGHKHYFSSFNLSLPRQSKTNPHPTRGGIIEWMDKVIEWIPDNSDMNFESLEKPGATTMSRGKTFIYKRMKESL